MVVELTLFTREPYTSKYEFKAIDINRLDMANIMLAPLL